MIKFSSNWIEVNWNSYLLFIEYSEDYDKKVPRRDPDVRIKTEPDRVPEVRIKSEPNESKWDKVDFGSKQKVKEEAPKEPEKPSMELSGKLLEDTNVFNGVVIK